MLKNETGTIFYAIGKNELKMNEDLNIRPETITLLGENIGVSSCDIGLGDFSLTSVAKETKVKQVERHQTKSFCTAKVPTNEKAT